MRNFIFDIVINNVGIGLDLGIFEFKVNIFCFILVVNVEGIILLIELFLFMMESMGKFLNILFKMGFIVSCVGIDFIVYWIFKSVFNMYSRIFINKYGD